MRATDRRLRKVTRLLKTFESDLSQVEAIATTAKAAATTTVKWGVRINFLINKTTGWASLSPEAIVESDLSRVD